jgi:Carboxypeptidase regulatory-like domain/TonB dependent receptor
MRWVNVSGSVLFAFWFTAGSLSAQTTTGTITGRVVDDQGLSVPGVTITAESPALQGAQTAVTSVNGDYIVPLLPPGAYQVTFELSGFQMQKKTVTVTATHTVPLNITMGPAVVEENVIVVGQAADVLTRTAQVATNFKQDVIAALPTNRDINATLLMAPAVHPTGPLGAYSIAGALSFESLFMVNGVTANENIRGQAVNLYIEEAIQETVVASDGISAEYGRFSGGVVNVITKSGTNLFSGSFRETLNNDDWRSSVVGNGNFAPLAPGQTTPQCNRVTGIGGTQIPDPHCFAADAKVSKVVPTTEYVFGGPIVKDRLTFFTAGRFQNQESARNTALPVATPYVFEDRRQRYEIKLTGSLTPNHRFDGSYQKEAVTQVNQTFSAASMDLASLYTRDLPLDGYQVSYNGILSNQFFVEARLSMRHFTSIGTGAPTTDLVLGTLLLDQGRGGLRYWSPTFCGVCDDEKRDNDNEYVKATYFKSTKRGGSHTVVFGFDSFNDKRFVNNHQSGSDYRILGTTSTVRSADADCAVSPGCIFPQFLPGGSTVLQYNPILVGSEGTNIRTNALFVNDNVRWNEHLTFNLGLRWDKNNAVDSTGAVVTKTGKLAPRVGVIWDPKGDGVWAVSGSYGLYTAALSNSIANMASAGGNEATIRWVYNGPPINADLTAPTASLVTPQAAIQQVLNWCARDSRGFCTTASPSSSQLPGVSVQIGDEFTSPHVSAYAIGMSRQFGTRAVLRADYSYRDYHDFYSLRTDRTTGIVVDDFGNRADLSLVENTNALTRQYSGVTLSGTYHLGARTDFGGNYTLSRLWGNFEGENGGSGPLTADVFQYPEYRQLSWYAPEGDLAQDQRHRVMLWINYEVPWVNRLSLSLLQAFASGLPYGAGGAAGANPNGQIGFSSTATVDARPFVPDLGYVTPQGAASENYYYSARDAFRTDWMRRTDFAANYDLPLGGGARQLTAFVQVQVINIFNNQDLCACGGDVFSNGGSTALNRIGSAVSTPANTTTLPRFNPLTETPIQGVNWNYGANFGAPLNRFAFTTPRMFRLTFGVRF